MDGGCRASSLGVLINKLSQSCRAPSNSLPLPFPGAKSSSRHCRGLSLSLLRSLSPTLDILPSPKPSSYSADNAAADGVMLATCKYIEIHKQFLCTEQIAHTHTHSLRLPSWFRRQASSRNCCFLQPLRVMKR